MLRPWRSFAVTNTHRRGSEAAVAIGNFDGVHVGHRALIERTRELAEAHDARAIALTFDPHPSAVLRAAPADAAASLERRLELLDEAGLDAVVIEPFTRDLAARAPNAFVDDVVIHALARARSSSATTSPTGARRAGTTDALRAHGGRAGIEVDVVPAVEVAGEVASSTRIRAHLRAGDLAGAARLLGRRWDVDGVVVHGAKRGRTIGVPTANIEPRRRSADPGRHLRGHAAGDGVDLPAVASLGTNPTFVEGGGMVLEVHVLDWDGDLYDHRVRTTFVATAARRGEVRLDRGTRHTDQS